MRAILLSLVAGLGATLIAAPASAAGTAAEWSAVAARRIACHLVYPFVPDAPRGNSVALARFVIDDQGRVGEAAIVRGSGIAAFDRAVLMAIKLSAPLPRPPEGRPSFAATVPVRFIPSAAPYNGPPAGRRSCIHLYRA